MELTWKKHVRTELQKRDRKQKEGYEGLLETYLKLLDRLDLQNFLAEKLHLEPHSNEFAGSHAQEPLSLEVAERHIQHQLELTELHKDRAELAHTVLDLNKTLRLKDVEINDHCARMSKQAHDISTLSRKCLDQAAYVEEIERQYQLLQDEHSVLQLTYLTLNEKLQRTQGENQQLVARWMEEKALEADRLNYCNEQEETYRRLLGKLRRRLEKLKRSPMTSPAQISEQPISEQQNGPATSEHGRMGVQEPNEGPIPILDLIDVDASLQEQHVKSPDLEPPKEDQNASGIQCSEHVSESLCHGLSGADGVSAGALYTSYNAGIVPAEASSSCSHGS